MERYAVEWSTADSPDTYNRILACEIRGTSVTFTVFAFQAGFPPRREKIGSGSFSTSSTPAQAAEVVSRQIHAPSLY